MSKMKNTLPENQSDWVELNDNVSLPELPLITRSYTVQGLNGQLSVAETTDFESIKICIQKHHRRTELELDFETFKELASLQYSLKAKGSYSYGSPF